MSPPDIFEDVVFGSLAEMGKRSATARRAQTHQFSDTPDDMKPPSMPERQRQDFDALMHQSMLNFTSFMAADKTARIHATDRGYRIDLGNQRFAFDLGAFHTLLASDNPDADIAFDDELVNFEPEPGLVRKSKVPLWLLRQAGSRTIAIVRMWEPN